MCRMSTARVVHARAGVRTVGGSPRKGRSGSELDDAPPRIVTPLASKLAWLLRPSSTWPSLGHPFSRLLKQSQTGSARDRCHSEELLNSVRPLLGHYLWAPFPHTILKRALGTFHAICRASGHRRNIYVFTGLVVQFAAPARVRTTGRCGDASR